MKKKREIPFPQANSMELIYSILLLIGESGLSKRDVSKEFNIDERQGAYYLDSLEFLGLIEKINTKYFYTKGGYNIIAEKNESRKKQFVWRVLQNFHISYLYYHTKGVSDDYKKSIISNYLFNNFGLGLNTAKRRASTVISWVKWIDNINKSEE